MKKFSNKFHVISREGIPIIYPTFILRLDGKSIHDIVALEAYAASIKPEDPDFADELMYIARLARDNSNFTQQQLTLALKTR